MWYQNRRAKWRKKEQTRKGPGRPAHNAHPQTCSGEPIPPDELERRERHRREKRIQKQLERQQRKLSLKGVHVTLEQLRKEYDANQSKDSITTSTTTLLEKSIKEITPSNVPNKSSSFTIERLLAPLNRSEERGPPSPGTLMRAAPSPLHSLYPCSPVQTQCPSSPLSKKGCSPSPSLNSPSSPNFPYSSPSLVSLHNSSFISNNTNNNYSDSEETSNVNENISMNISKSEKMISTEDVISKIPSDDIEKAENNEQFLIKLEKQQSPKNEPNSVPEKLSNVKCKSEPEYDANYNENLSKHEELFQYLKSNTTLLAEEWHKRWHADNFPAWLQVAHGTTPLHS